MCPSMNKRFCPIACDVPQPTQNPNINEDLEKQKQDWWNNLKDNQKTIHFDYTKDKNKILYILTRLLKIIQ